jgi:hypothetical protein
MKQYILSEIPATVSSKFNKKSSRAAEQLQFGYLLLQVDEYVTGKAGFEKNYIFRLLPCART